MDTPSGIAEVGPIIGSCVNSGGGTERPGSRSPAVLPRRATVPPVDLEPAASSLLLHLTQARKSRRTGREKPMSTTFEILGMVFGTVGLTLGTLGLIFSVTALRKINELEARLAKEAPRED